MSDRKEDILKVALRFFNERGLDNVTTRDIAKEVNISQGNLTYHFPSKKDIVNQLVQDMARSVDEALASGDIENARNSLVLYFHQVKIIFETHLKFRFMFSRWGETISSFPEIQKFLQDFLKKRFDAWKELHELLVKEELARPLLSEDSHAQAYVINMLALFWHQEFMMYFPDLDDKQKVEKALAIFFQSYKPYLTDNGWKELSPFLVKLEHY